MDAQFYHPDINECERAGGGCHYSNSCINTVGSYICDCPEGCVLDEDKKTCRGILMQIVMIAMYE